MTNPLDLKTDVIQVRLSKRDKQRIERRKRKHETVSAYIRRRIAEDVPLTKKVDQ